MVTQNMNPYALHLGGRDPLDALGYKPAIAAPSRKPSVRSVLEQPLGPGEVEPRGKSSAT